MENDKKDVIDSKLKSLPAARLNEAYKKEMHQNLMEQVVIHENMSMKQRIKNRILISIGSLLVVGLLLFILYMTMGGGMKVSGDTGYQDVVQHLDGVENLEDFQAFLGDIEERKKTRISVIRYGIEGQEWIHSLDFNGNEIKVSLSVDGEFVEEYSCENIVNKGKNNGEYVLGPCTGGQVQGEFELLILHVKHKILNHGWNQDEE